MGFLTSMPAFVEIFSGLHCERSQERQHLEGNTKNGSRTAQASEWPEELDKLILHAIEKQIEMDIVDNEAEALPSEGEARRSAPSKEGKEERSTHSPLRGADLRVGGAAFTDVA